jgi:hypothetical protein
MSGDSKSAMQCLEFDALLADALDERLSGTQRERFEAHRTTCASCGPLFAEAKAGLGWLRSLQEVEPPKHLVHNILAATVGTTHAPQPMARPVETTWDKLRAWARQGLGPILQPKFVMSFGMAFFSISVLLNLAGFKTSDLKRLDLRPSALIRGYYETQGKIVKYYENIRFVYEIESRVQQLKKATTPENPPAQPQPKERKDKDRSGEPDQKQNRNYSREADAVTMARLESVWFGADPAPRR